MGIDISAKLMYGKYYDDLTDKLDEDALELLNEELYDGGIEYASPYYDSDKENWFVGYSLPEEFDFEGCKFFIEELKEAEEKFKERFGTTGNVIATQHVY